MRCRRFLHDVRGSRGLTFPLAWQIPVVDATHYIIADMTKHFYNSASASSTSDITTLGLLSSYATALGHPFLAEFRRPAASPTYAEVSLPYGRVTLLHPRCLPERFEISSRMSRSWLFGPECGASERGVQGDDFSDRAFWSLTACCTPSQNHVEHLPSCLLGSPALATSKEVRRSYLGDRSDLSSEEKLTSSPPHR